MTEFVRSRYRAPWYGVVLRREERKYDGKKIGDLCTILVVKDRRGNWVRKPWYTTLDEGWLVPCESWIDPLEPYNYSIPHWLMLARWAAGDRTIELRKRRKSIRRQLRGYE